MTDNEHQEQVVEVIADDDPRILIVIDAIDAYACANRGFAEQNQSLVRFGMQADQIRLSTVTPARAGVSAFLGELDRRGYQVVAK